MFWNQYLKIFLSDECTFKMQDNLKLEKPTESEKVMVAKM